MGYGLLEFLMLLSSPMLLLLLGCAADPVPAAAPRQLPAEERLLAGELSALDELSQRPGPPGELAARLRALDAQRAAVHAAEVPMMRDSATDSLAEGRLEAAASRLALGLRAFPEDPSLHALLDALVAQVRAAEDPQRAAASASLATALGDAGQDELADALRAEAATAALRARYAPEALSTTRAAQEAVTLKAAEQLLDELERAYVLAPDWGTVAAAGDRALAALARSPGARLAWPELGGVVLPTGAAVRTVADAKALLGARAAALERVGVPREVVVAEWVGAAIGALDPWSRVVWPAEIARWQAGHAGVYQGLGLELGLDAAGRVVVEGLLPSGPAWESGIHQDDVLTSVHELDGPGRFRASDHPVSVREERAQAALLGEAGSRVELRLERGETAKRVRLVRGPVKPEVLQGWSRAEDNSWTTLFDPEAGLAYVAVERFKPPTHTDFDALVAAEADNIRGLVLDLRGNPGGDVNAAVQLADRFIAEGLLADLDGRVLPDTGPDVDPATGQELAEWNEAVPGHALEDVAVAVLVDADTASAAEVLAGALQERADAVVIGAPTWGKGLAQVIYVGEDGDHAAQYTNLVWTLPSGRRLSRRLDGGGGIQPQLVLRLSPGEQYQVDRRARLRTALRTHHDGTPLRPPDAGLHARLPPLDDDPMLLLASLALRLSLGEATQAAAEEPAATE